MNGTCQGCDAPAEDEHTCPYAEDINGDYDSLCNCCADCEQKCLEDI